MKKLILATVLAGLSTAAAANVLVNNGYYVQADLGYSNLEAKYNDNRPNDNKLEDKGLGYGISFGKDTDLARYALDYTNYGKINSSYTYQPQTNTNTSITSSGELKAQSLGLSAIYDFDTVSGFTPYAGARVGINQIKSTVSTVTTTAAAQSRTTHSQKQENKVGFGVLAGAHMPSTHSLALMLALSIIIWVSMINWIQTASLRLINMVRKWVFAITFKISKLLILSLLKNPSVRYIDGFL